MKRTLITILTLALVALAMRANVVFPGKPDPYKRIQVSATIYYPSVAQCDDSPFETASMAKINRHHPEKHRWVAVSRDLKALLNFGDRIFVSGTGIYDGYWEVQDVMNKRFTNKIDFLVSKHSQRGSWEEVEIIIVK